MNQRFRRRLPPRVQVGLGDTVRDYWLARAEQHTSDSYAGVPLSKFPEDLRVYEHLLWAARPSVVVELGVQFGGSTLWFRDRLMTLAHYGCPEDFRVVGVDVDVTAAASLLEEVDPVGRGIHLVQGDVRDPDLARRVAAELPHGATVMVVEDSAHTYETTKEALTHFADLVTPVVEDGCVDIEEMRLSADWPRGVLPAIRDWLAAGGNREFVVRRDLEAYGLSCHPGGFLQRL